MRAHVVIVFGCWDDWGVWEDSSSIYLYSLSVHHARIVQQRGCQLLTGWRYRPSSAGVGGSSTATLCGGEQASRQQRAASPAASALAVVVVAAAAAVTATILRFLLNLEAARPFHSEICHHYTTTTTSID